MTDWIKEHLRVCIEKNISSLTPFQLHKHVVKSRMNIEAIGKNDNSIVNNQNDTTTFTLNNDMHMQALILAMSESCLVVSNNINTTPTPNAANAYISMSLQECNELFQRKKSCRLLALRFSQKNDSSINTNQYNNNSDSLISRFTSLSLLAKNQSNHHIRANNNNERKQSKIDQSVLELGAYFMALYIVEIHGEHAPIHNQKNDDKLLSNNKESQSGSRVVSGLFNISKKIMTKASTKVTSILASYDLAEAPMPIDQYNSSSTNNNNVDRIGINNDDEYDDAFLHRFDDNLNDLDDNDDAQILQQQQQTAGNQNIKDSYSILETDIVWNVHFIIDCWSLIIHHAKEKISKMKQDYINDDVDQLTTVAATNATQNSSKGIICGLTLNCWGDDALSFLSFCHETGKIATSTSTPLPIKLYNSKSDVGNILSNLTVGLSLELLLLTLPLTGKAVLCADGGIIVLLPSNPSSDYKVQDTNLRVNEVDIAIFKLGSSIKSIERRIEKLTTQSEVLKKQALSSKKNRNSKLALLHMKRRQIILNEIDKSSASLLNLEGGLHSLKRVRSDAQVLKAYEMMNVAMKDARKDISLSQIEDVIDEINENNKELEQMHECLHSLSGVDGNTYDMDELEKELLDLVVYDNQDDKVLVYNDEDIKEDNIKLEKIAEVKEANSEKPVTDNKVAFDSKNTILEG